MDKFLLRKRAREELTPIQSYSQRQIGEDETISRPTIQFASDEINRPHTSNELTASHVPKSGTKNARVFKAEWTRTYPWLIYDEVSARAYCKVCKEAKEKHLLDTSKLVKGAFIVDGFANWKHAIDIDDIMTEFINRSSVRQNTFA